MKKRLFLLIDLFFILLGTLAAYIFVLTRTFPFPFCPRCQTEMDNVGPNFRCPKCGHIAHSPGS